MNLVGYPLTCRLSWTWDVSSVLRASLEGMVFARRINVLTTDLLCCAGWCESNAKYLLVWVAFWCTSTSTSPLGRVDTLVSRNTMVGVLSMSVACSTVNWTCGLAELQPISVQCIDPGFWNIFAHHDSTARLPSRGSNDGSAAQRLKMASDLSSTFTWQFYKRDCPVSFYKYCLSVKNLQAVQGAWRGKPEEKIWKAENLIL